MKATGRPRPLRLMTIRRAAHRVRTGVAARLHERHYYVTATTGAVDQVYRQMTWFNAQWKMDVDIANVTSAYAGINLAGPQARAVISSPATSISRRRHSLWRPGELASPAFGAHPASACRNSVSDAVLAWAKRCGTA
jgi:glycine cleavage system aminomethyltransferase T